MPDCLGTIIERYEEQTQALKDVARTYGEDVTYRDYDLGGSSIRLWLVDMPHSWCDMLQVQHPSRSAPFDEGFALIYKHVRAGVNIAPKKRHRLSFHALRKHLTGNERSMAMVSKIFEEKGE